MSGHIADVPPNVADFGIVAGAELRSVFRFGARGHDLTEVDR